MTLKILVGSALVSTANAVNWAMLVAGSNSYSNYRHQADLCHSYQVLVSKGFDQDHIITMAYDDIAYHEDNPFPGKIFNTPDPTGPGTDVYDGCRIDYKGSDVSPGNFVNLLLGNGTTGGNGRTLNTGPDDDLFIYYVDHGAAGLIQFPDGDVLHATEFQTTLKSMHNQNRYGRMVIYIEACHAGSMLLDLPSDLNIYAVTAVGPDTPSMGTYCGWDSSINGQQIGSCLGDLFSVFWIRSVLNGDGSRTLNELFHDVYGGVASYAALHYGHEINVQYGDLSMGDLTVREFFYGSSQSAIKQFAPRWQAPLAVFAAPHLAMNQHTLRYDQASALPTYKGAEHWMDMLEATNALTVLLDEQKMVQTVHWILVGLVYVGDPKAAEETWTKMAAPLNPTCELRLHRNLVKSCAGVVDLGSSYALQFHQVVVNLCSLGLTVVTDYGLASLAETTCRFVEGSPTGKGLLV